MIKRKSSLRTSPDLLSLEFSASPIRLLEEKFERALSRPKVSIIIANHNGVDALWHCLFALKTQTYPPYEILLVDNASRDASVSFTRTNYPRVKILECQENFGPTMAYNLGVKTATGDLVALLEPDMVVTPEWLSRMVEDFQNNWPKFGILTAPARASKSGDTLRLATHQTLNFLGNPVPGFFEDPSAAFYPDRGPVLFPRFFSPDGPFDEEYFISQEDAYLGWKFLLLRHRMARSSRAKVFQNDSSFIREMPEWKVFYYQARNRWLNLLLFYEGGNLLKILPWVLAEAVLRLLKSLGTGFGSFCGTLFAMGWILLHPFWIYKKRGMIQEKRKTSDRDPLRYLSGRVLKDGGMVSRLINLISLVYCRMAGLEVLEFQNRPITSS